MKKNLLVFMYLLICSTPVMAQWIELGGPNSLAADQEIYSLVCDPSGNVFAGGRFLNSAGNRYVAKWDGSSWAELGGANGLAANNSILSICRDPSGNVYAAGTFTNSAGKAYVAKWDGNSWTELSGLNGSGPVNEIISIISDAVGNIYAAGILVNTSGKLYVAKWDGSSWSELGGLNGLSANDVIRSLCFNPAGNFFAAGSFYTSSGSASGTYVAKWNGTTWSVTGNGENALFNGQINSICSDPDGNIYAAGDFTNGTSPSSGKMYVAKWDGTVWSELGGLNALGADDRIESICSDGSGNIYAGGDFKNAPSSANGKAFVARWDASSWAETGGQNALAANDYIMSVCSDASGKIYAGGYFKNNSLNRYVARFTGTTPVKEIQSESAENMGYPNPVVDFFSFRVAPSRIGSTYAIYQPTGKVLQSGRVLSEQTTINLSTLSPGMYLLRIGGSFSQKSVLLKQ